MFNPCCWWWWWLGIPLPLFFKRVPFWSQLWGWFGNRGCRLIVARKPWQGKCERWGVLWNKPWPYHVHSKLMSRIKSAPHVAWSVLLHVRHVTAVCLCAVNTRWINGVILSLHMRICWRSVCSIVPGWWHITTNWCILAWACGVWTCWLFERSPCDHCLNH